MAIAKTRTLLALDRWAEVVGYNPLHFNQVNVAQEIMRAAACGDPVKQYAWQENDRIGREEIAQAIAEAEAQIRAQVGYSLLPTWEVDERMPTVQPASALVYGSGVNVRGYRNGVQLAAGHYLSGGIEAKSLISAGAAVVYTDADSDGYAETATITVATAVTDPQDIALYYPGESGATEYEIRPLRSVSIIAGIATIRAWRHQLVLPELLDALSPQQVDGTDNAKFLGTVDVYRHFNDPQRQVQFLWSPSPSSCSCGDGACTVCAHQTQYGCLLASDFRLGTVTYGPATWDDTAEDFASADWAVARQPERLRLWYYAGLQDKTRLYPRLQMSPRWERVVAQFAAALLDRPVCGCSGIREILMHQAEDLAYSVSTPAQSASYTLGSRVINNPFGTTRGALSAWGAVCENGARLGRAVRI